MINLQTAYDQWTDLAASIPKDDEPMLSESWNDYTDSLTKNGDLSALQYHYAPAYDEPMPGYGSRFDDLADDREFILDAMGVTMRAKNVATRPGAENWRADASHWRVTLGRGTDQPFDTFYSMGSAHTGEPELCDVLNCLLSDAVAADQSFDEWCSDLGMNPDSINDRDTYDACRQTSVNLRQLFTAPEIDDLHEIFQDY